MLEVLSLIIPVSTIGKTIAPTSRSLVERLIRKAAFAVRNRLVNVIVTNINKFAARATIHIIKAVRANIILLTVEYVWFCPKLSVNAQKVSFVWLQLNSERKLSLCPSLVFGMMDHGEVKDSTGMVPWLIFVTVCKVWLVKLFTVSSFLR